ncbi:hypothetical protein [Mesorhizobium sp. ISC15]|uniref:hypothetical protein n=1 Tax=Mesorhizobium sp. ISC15 TaxID=3076429 RepID=UPI00301BFF11
MANDFYEIHLVEPADPDKNVLVRSLTSHGVEGVYFNATGEPGYDCSVPKASLSGYRFDATHYFRGYSFQTTSPGQFLLSSLPALPRFIIWRDRLEQKRFNRRPLVREDRIDMLRFFLAKTIKNGSFRTTPIGLLEMLYSRRGFLHPERELVTNYYRLMLDSFVATGELLVENHSYRLSPHGVARLAEFELENKRFKESSRQQTLIGWLTIAIVAIGAVQAYVTYLTVP